MVNGGNFENMAAHKLFGLGLSRWLNRIQYFCGGSLGISDNLINFWENIIESKMADGGHFQKNGRPRSFWARYLMNHCLDRIHICCSGFLGICNDLINFWE